MNLNKKCYFLCVATQQNDPIVKEIESDSMCDAIDKFENITKLKAKHCSGPYFKKRNWSLKDEKNVIFSNEVKSAIYDQWYVKAHLLNKPFNTAFLFFTKRVDGKSAKPPAGNIIVNLGELEFV